MKQLFSCLAIIIALNNYIFCQTNVSGSINQNTIWTLSKSPYYLQSLIDIKDGAKLTIENGVKVYLQNNTLRIGYYGNGGILEANTSTFSNGEISFHNQSGGSIASSSFTSVRTNFYDFSNPLITNNNFDISSSLYLYSEEVFPKISGNIIGSKKLFLSFTITKDITFKKIINLDYYLNSLIDVKNGAKLNIETGVNLYLQNNTLRIGYLGNGGIFNASGVTINNGELSFHNQSTGTVSNCTFTNVRTNFYDTSNPLVTNNNFDISSTLYFFSEEAFPRINGNSYGNKKIYLSFNISKNISWKKITDVDYYLINLIDVRNGSKLIIENGVKIFLQNNTIRFGYYGNSGVLEAKGITFNNGGISFHNQSIGTMNNCDLTNVLINTYDTGKFSINNSNLDIFSKIRNETNIVINALNNFWGDPTGPRHSSNPAGYGSIISDKVDYIPFFTKQVEISISPFIIGQRIMSDPSGVNVRTSQLTDILFMQSGGVHGTIVSGPINDSAGGFTGNWWNVEWESSPPVLGNTRGWIAEAFMKQVWPDGDISKLDFSKNYYTSLNHFWRRGYAPTSLQRASDFHPNAYGNCTWYAFGRMLELGYDPVKLELIAAPGSADASKWDDGATLNKIRIDKVPSIGAIAQTDKGANGYGHVAIVESINADSTITISESSYSESLTSIWNFLWRHRTIPPSTFENYIIVPKGSSMQFNVTLQAFPQEGGTVFGSGIFSAGSSVTISAKAVSGWTFVNWTEDGNAVSTEKDFTFTLNSSRNLIANFKKLDGATVIVNGNFDLDLTNWINVQFTSGSYVTAKSELNNKFISLMHTTTDDWCSIGQEILSKLNQGQKYILTYKYKVAAGNNIELGVRFADNSTVMHSTGVDKNKWNASLISDNQWHTESISFIVTPDHPLLSEPVFSIIFDYLNVGEVYVDDINISTTTNIDDQKIPISDSFQLHQNYPNPFNPVTYIKYELPSQGFVTLKIYDSLGKEITTLVSGEQSKGNYQALFNASNLASGVYYYRLNVGKLSSVRKFVLLK